MVQPPETARPLSTATSEPALAGSRNYEPDGSEPGTSKVSYLEMRKTIIAVGLAAMTLSTAACNTVRGIGQDLQSVANDVDEAT